jgi:hypothetical protein
MSTSFTSITIGQRTEEERPFAIRDDIHEMLDKDPTVNTRSWHKPDDIASASKWGEPPQAKQAEIIKSSGGAMQEGPAQVLIKTDDKFGNFINSKWRPLMAIIYMVTCTCDFVIFPILWSVLQALSHGQVNSQWMPITLQGAGLYHIAMGAILGIAAYGRSQEKIVGKA